MKRPPDHYPLRAPDLPELSDDAAEMLRRARVFLYGVRRPPVVTTALLAGYTEAIHRLGCYQTGVLSGERSFGEWREWRALRPPRDPDLPELVAELLAFADKWQARALAAAEGIEDEEDRAEVTSFLAGRTYPSKTWSAKARAQCIRKLGKVPAPFFRQVYNELAAQGIEDELGGFDETLSTVQDFIRQAPVDEAEIEDIRRRREDAASWLHAWLHERRDQLAAALGEVDLTVLGLGPMVPPPGFEPPINLLYSFNLPAKA